MALADEDDVGNQPVFLVRPSDNVYSYFMFIEPTEKRKKRGCKKFNWDIAMAYFLVALNFFMQGVLLYMIFQEVVISNVDWQSGILKLGDDKVLGLVTEAPKGCNDGASLCFTEGGNITCAPPSVQLTGRWTELDTNGDDIWTRKEVIDARELLKCKYVVDPVEVFDVLINMLKKREKLIWLHPEIKSGTAIRLPYFTYAMGDLVMCGYRSARMCPNLVQRGFFDAPMKHNTAPRVGNSIDSALEYCNELLKSGGTCETLLPSTYAVWKKQGEIECGGQSFDRFKYTNPGNGVQKSLVSVDYDARQTYEGAQDPGFRAFKGIMICTWLLAMLCEFKEMIKVLTVCARFPDAADFGDDAVLMEQDPADPEDVRYRIQGFTSDHRWAMVVLCIIRAALTCVLSVVGVSYLIKTNTYANLIMNGVALLFVAEIAAVLYAQLLREEIRDQCGDIKPMRVRMYGIDYLNRRPALIDVICVLALFAIVWIIMDWQLRVIVQPVSKSLECACVSSGSHCVEAQKFDHSFWHDYWVKAVPGVFSEVGKLKASMPAAAASLLATSSTLQDRMASVEQNDEALMERIRKFKLTRHSLEVQHDDHHK